MMKIVNLTKIRKKISGFLELYLGEGVFVNKGYSQKKTSDEHYTERKIYNLYSKKGVHILTFKLTNNGGINIFQDYQLCKKISLIFGITTDEVKFHIFNWIFEKYKLKKVEDLKLFI